MNRLFGKLTIGLLVLLNACGPGTTGTGGGDNTDYVALAGANPAPVCSADWAAGLACPSQPASDPITATRHPGTLRVQYAARTTSGSGSTDPDYVLVFEANHVRLEGGCPRISYEGDWGQLASGVDYFFGGYLDAKLIEPALALASVQPAAGGTPLQVELRGADGRLLLPALSLQKVAGPDLAPKPCP